MKKGFVLFFKKNCTITADVVLFKRPVVKAGITVNLNSGNDSAGIQSNDSEKFGIIDLDQKQKKFCLLTLCYSISV